MTNLLDLLIQWVLVLLCGIVIALEVKHPSASVFWRVVNVAVPIVSIVFVFIQDLRRFL